MSALRETPSVSSMDVLQLQTGFFALCCEGSALQSAVDAHVQALRDEDTVLRG